MRFFLLLGLALVGYFILRAWFRRVTDPRFRRGPDAWPDPNPPLQSLSELDAEMSATGPAGPPCPVCEHPVEPPGSACPACGSRHHPECWQLNDGCGHCRPVG
jgi:hypothetical protein